MIETQNIFITPSLRLRPYDGDDLLGQFWYTDEETVWLVDGVKKPYTIETLKAMYSYLNSHGELYWIEIEEDGVFVPIGDVTLSKENIPIVIGDKNYRGLGIGRKVVEVLIHRAKMLGYSHLEIQEIYDWNVPSQKLFTSLGFEEIGITKNGKSYRLNLKG